MDKPRVRLLNGYWWCYGMGVTGAGDTAMEAYRYWVKARDALGMRSDTRVYSWPLRLIDSSN